jgi:hypothetical protein
MGTTALVTSPRLDVEATEGRLSLVAGLGVGTAGLAAGV